VAHVVIALEIGGLEIVVATLAEQASSRFRPHVICLEGLGPLASRLRNAKVPVECIGQSDTSLARSVITLRRRLKELAPHVVHTHNDKAHIRGALATIGWRRAPPLVHTRHGPSRVTSWAAVLAHRIAVRRSAFIVSVSKDANEIARRDKAPPDRLRVIHNGVDVGRCSSSYHQPADRPHAVAVGRLAPVKDLSTMLRAARIICDVQPDFRLDIVGEGPSCSALHSLRAELGLQRHVIFHGVTEDVTRFLKGPTLFLQSSRSEGISLTLLEAMAAGLPVVATRVGGTPEVVEHGVTGMLTAPGDPEGFADAVLSVMNDGRLAFSMSRAARARAERYFDRRQMTSAYEGLYEEILSNCRNTVGDSADAHA
jgi:glycosyltransferase involved in cell wall biosynthesis